MLVTAVVIFIVCWLPYYVHEIIIDAIEFTIGSEGDKNAQLIVRFVTVVLALTNSIANPIVYGWMNKNFRKEIYLRFQRILTRFGPHNQVEPSTNNVPTTRGHQSTDDTNLSRLVNRSEEQAYRKSRIIVNQETLSTRSCYQYVILLKRVHTM
ncbi:hypothetical protein KUTeg_011928 [Tegillarca granosa]|uniref:G-protein coupled receptors family 1 profile domain-containing protein n=1 Tax=Tegillarca granosa TaxID=220873 RepID=A0ABQ9F3B9_TEGGR|nr:hypothetical protein KUTeg_011928 [Tegillarca granosa]